MLPIYASYSTKAKEVNLITREKHLNIKYQRPPIAGIITEEQMYLDESLKKNY